MALPELSRRQLLTGGLGLAGVGALAACSGGSAPATGSGATSPTGLAASPSASAARRVVTASLVPQRTSLDLGGVRVATWAYGDRAPGQLIRATAGDLLRVTVDNRLPAETTVHWHGIRLRNAADGVPGVTQDPIKPGARYVYEFTAPDPGTYFFHPHVGVQLDRGLYAPLIIDDPHEPGRYDAEWIVVLDDWIDGTGTTPDAVLAKLIADGGSGSGGMGMGMGGMGHGSMHEGAMGGASGTAGPSTAPTGAGPMGGMGGMGGMPMGPAPWGDVGDVTYPNYLVNGKTPTDPTTFTATPGQRVRIRFINAASDTVFTVALGGHRMTITHTDGHRVQPSEAGAFYIGMGERYDVMVTLGDGAFPLVAVPFNKQGRAMAVVRTASGSAPSAQASPAELTGEIAFGSRLQPAAESRLPAKDPEAALNLVLNGSMQPYRWGINGAPYGQNTPLVAKAGQRLRINAVNMTMMSHPLHLHGPAFALADTGLRKDTVLLAPMESRQLDLDPDVGDWMVHCHNAYHGEAGMMIVLQASA